MKKLLFTVFFLIYSLSYSQTSFGIKGGLLLANQELGSGITIAFDDEAKLSYYFGGFVEHKMSKFAIQGDISYVNFGFKSNLKRHSFDPSPNFKYKTDMHTLVVAVSAKYYIMDIISIGVGGYYGLNIGSDYIVNGTNYNSENKVLSKNNDFGFVSSADFEIYKGLFVEAKYYLGLADVNKEPVLNPYNGDYSAKNRAFALGAGYRF
ncbi:MAG: outer membrane beta-barrel protein [Flavobacteriaceae bacterium]